MEKGRPHRDKLKVRGAATSTAAALSNPQPLDLWLSAHIAAERVSGIGRALTMTV